MGSEISKIYAVDETPTGTAGLSGMWNLHQGVHRETGEAVTIWIFSPTVALNGLKDKAVKEVLLDCMRRDLKSMKEMRHPNIPEVGHQLENSVPRANRDRLGLPPLPQVIDTYDVGEKKTASILTKVSSKMAMITKPVVCSLTDILEGRGPTYLSSQADYEVARGLCGVAEALQYVHTVSKKIHLSLSPECVVLTQTGVWKLAGFGFSTEIGLPCPYFRLQGVNAGAGRLCGPWRTQPPLAYSSPEATSSGNISPSSDIFSFGVFMHQFLAPDGPNSPDSDLLKLRGNNHPTVQAHEHACSNAQGLVLYSSAQALVQSLVSVNPDARTPLVQLAARPIFRTPQVMALQMVDSLGYRNPQEATCALSASREVVLSFPLRLQCKCILPSLLDSAASFQDGKLWPSILPLAGDILGKMDSADVVERGKQGIQGKFIPATKRDEPETLRHIVNLIPVFVKKCSNGFIQEDVLPTLCRSIAKEGYPRLQQAALEVVSLNSLNTMIKVESLEEDVLSRVCWLVVKSKDIKIRVNALVALSKFLDRLPLKCIMEKVLPTLKFAVENDKTIAVQLCCLETYETIASRIPQSATVITNIIPSIVPLLANKDLTLEQYEMVVGKVKTLLDGAIEGQRDARSYTVVAKDKQHTMKPISSSTISSSKELKPNLPANGGPSCTTSSTMTTVTKSYVSASANNSLKDSEALYSDVHHLSTLQHKPLKDPSSTVGMQGDLNNIWKTAPITDQEIKNETASCTSPKLDSNFVLQQQSANPPTIGTGIVVPSISPTGSTVMSTMITSDFNTKNTQQPGYHGSGLVSSSQMMRSTNTMAIGQTNSTTRVARDEASFPIIAPPPQYQQLNNQNQASSLNTSTAEPEYPFAFLTSQGSS